MAVSQLCTVSVALPGAASVAGSGGKLLLAPCHRLPTCAAPSVPLAGSDTVTLQPTAENHVGRNCSTTSDAPSVRAPTRSKLVATVLVIGSNKDAVPLLSCGWKP